MVLLDLGCKLHLQPSNAPYLIRIFKKLGFTNLFSIYSYGNKKIFWTLPYLPKGQNPESRLSKIRILSFRRYHLLEFQKFFSITRTIFSHSRSEQFWWQNTNKLIFENKTLTNIMIATNANEWNVWVEFWKNLEEIFFLRRPDFWPFVWKCIYEVATNDEKSRFRTHSAHSMVL